MRTAGDLFGLMAYLFVAYGGAPPREVVSAALRGKLDVEEETGGPHVSLVSSTADEAVPKKATRRRTKKTRRAQRAAA